MRLVCLMLLMTSALCADRQVLVRPVQVTLPSPSRAHFNEGYVVKGGRRNQAAFRIRVNADEGPWRLYVRAADDYFEPAGFEKPTSDLEWKFNEEHPNSYRVVTTADELVYSSTRPHDDDNKDLWLDLRCRVDWTDKPAPYLADLLFTLVVDADDDD